MDRSPLWGVFKNPWDVFKRDELAIEIAQIALPAALALAADPLASLIDTAFIGHIGPTELAAVGVAIAIFNQVSKITIFPVVSITTSSVAEEDATGIPRGEGQEIEMEKGFAMDSEKEHLISKVDSSGEMQTSSGSNVKMVEDVHQKRNIPSASTALLIASILGIVQAVFLILAAKPLLNYMGVKSDSSMMKPAQQYLTLRSVGAPAVLLSLAMQGVFRGFKDTKTPLYATIIGDAANIILDPIFIFVFKMGVTGAAIAHVFSQYLISLLLMHRLTKHVNLLSPSMKDLRFGKFLKNVFLLLLRVIAATFSVTVAASLAARLGSTSMAAFQICLQVWLASSLLADGLAVAGQAILASAFAKKDFATATAAATRVLQLAMVLGLALSLAVTVILQMSAGLFTKDVNVLHLLSLGIPFVALTQPINALAFVFDGINFGASDFTYSAYSMISVAILSILCLFVLSSTHGFVGIWIALSIFMTLRALVGFLRVGTRTGPWCFLRE